MPFDSKNTHGDKGKKGSTMVIALGGPMKTKGKGDDDGDDNEGSALSEAAGDVRTAIKGDDDEALADALATFMALSRDDD